MSHLICTDHKRRVLVTGETVRHREDQTECETKTVKIDKVILTPAQIRGLVPVNEMPDSERWRASRSQ